MSGWHPCSLTCSHGDIISALSLTYSSKQPSDLVLNICFLSFNLLYKATHEKLSTIFFLWTFIWMHNREEWVAGCPLIITNWKTPPVNFIFAEQHLSHLDPQLQALRTWSSHYSTEWLCLVFSVSHWIIYNPWAPASLTLPDKVASSSVECVWLFSPKRCPIFSTMCQQQLVEWTEQRPAGYDDVRSIQEKRKNAGKEWALTIYGFSLKRRSVWLTAFPTGAPCV